LPQRIAVLLCAANPPTKRPLRLAPDSMGAKMKKKQGVCRRSGHRCFSLAPRNHRLSDGVKRHNPTGSAHLATVWHDTLSLSASLASVFQMGPQARHPVAMGAARSGLLACYTSSEFPRFIGAAGHHDGVGHDSGRQVSRAVGALFLGSSGVQSCQRFLRSMRQAQPGQPLT
jgi:hypothetical protein